MWIPFDEQIVVLNSEHTLTCLEYNIEVHSMYTISELNNSFNKANLLDTLLHY
jgi:hypothetical protein